MADGTRDEIEVETLQPPEWIERCGAHVGATVPLPLDLVEMGLPDDLTAVVVANEPCPCIENSPGRVVLTTVDHLNNFVFELRVADALGGVESIRVTGYHKLYSEDRSEWLSVAHLRDGEVLRGLDGPLVVESLDRIAGTHRVYNMTVEGEHVYHVSPLGLLAHNNDCKQPKVIIIEGDKHPDAARHAQDAIDQGVTPDGVIDRPGAKPRRQQKTKDHPIEPAMDRDEFPPAVVDNGTGGSSVRPIPPGDDRGAGAALGNQLRDVPDGTPVRVKPINVPPKKTSG